MYYALILYMKLLMFVNIFIHVYNSSRHRINIFTYKLANIMPVYSYINTNAIKLVLLNKNLPRVYVFVRREKTHKRITSS